MSSLIPFVLGAVLRFAWNEASSLWSNLTCCVSGVSGVFADSPTDFLVDTRALSGSTPRGKVTCSISNPSGAKTDSYITPMADGTYRISYTPFEEGTHLIDILYDGVPIKVVEYLHLDKTIKQTIRFLSTFCLHKNSPVAVVVRRGCDPHKVKAFGPGLERGLVNKPNVFTIETKGIFQF